MWRLKGCPKCNGDIFIDHDLEGWYVHCLQCGFRRELTSLLEVEAELSKEGKELHKTGKEKVGAK